MAVVIVLEDGWDGHYVLSHACHQAGHKVTAVPDASLLRATLRAVAADVLVVDTAMPGICMGGLGALAAESGLPVVATGFSPGAPVTGLASFVPKPAASTAVVDAVQDVLTRRAVVAA